jgi:hypothetical protein
VTRNSLSFTTHSLPHSFSNLSKYEKVYKFYRGKLIMGTTKMNEWTLKVDAEVQIEVQKQDRIAEDYINGKIYWYLITNRVDLKLEDSEKSREGHI